MYEKFKLNIYYVLIVVISFITLAFLPMVGSDVGLDWRLPNTAVGWIVWVVTKLIIGIINMLIFHSFMLQAKLNVKDDEHFKAANEILRKLKDKEFIPRSPEKWNAQQYGKKGTSVVILSVFSAFALSQAILTYDYMALLSYLFTIIMGVIFGFIQMKNAEDYWTDEYYSYAIYYQKKMEVNHGN